MTNGSFDLEDKLTFEELSPSLQDMFKIMNVGSLLTNLLDYGTNGRNVKIDSDNTLLFEDDDFRTAKITNTQIQISDIDMQVWQTATAETEANPATQIIPKRIFLYDVSSTNLWYYQDWDNRWCIRKDTSVNTANSKPGDIIKLDRNVNVAFDPNYRFNRVVVDINQLYKEVRLNPTDYIYTDNDYNIYFASANTYYTPKATNTYPLPTSKTVEEDIEIKSDPYGVNGEEFPILKIVGDIELNGSYTIDALNILSTDTNLSPIINPVYYVLKFTDLNISGSNYEYKYRLCAYDSSTNTLVESNTKYTLTTNDYIHNIYPYRIITGVGFENSSEYINIDPNYNSDFYNDYVKDSILTGEFADIEIGGTLLADGFNYANYQSDSTLGVTETIPTYQIRADKWVAAGDGISIVSTGISNTYNVINTVNGIPTTLYNNLKLGYDITTTRYMVLWVRLKYKKTITHVFTDQEMLEEYYDLSSDKAHNQLFSRTWYYNPGLEKLYFYKYAKKAYEINSSVVN